MILESRTPLQIHNMGQGRPAARLIQGGAAPMNPVFVGPAPGAQPAWLHARPSFPISARPAIQMYCPTRCVPPSWVCGSRRGRQRILGTDDLGNPITLDPDLIDPHGDTMVPPPGFTTEYEYDPMNPLYKPPVATPATADYAPPVTYLEPGQLPAELPGGQLPAEAKKPAGAVGLLAAVAFALIGAAR